MIVDAEAPQACKIPCKPLNIEEKGGALIDHLIPTIVVLCGRKKKFTGGRGSRGGEQKKSAEGAIWGTMTSLRDR
jgi:hypothetical protein